MITDAHVCFILFDNGHVAEITVIPHHNADLLRQSLANAHSHMLVPHRGTLFLQTYVQFLTVVVLNHN